MRGNVERARRLRFWNAIGPSLTASHDLHARAESNISSRMLAVCCLLYAAAAAAAAPRRSTMMICK